MVRLVLDGSAVVVDLVSRALGRGAHVHARTECIAKACKGGLARSMKTSVRADAQEISGQLAGACDRRIAGLLLAARRTRALAVGVDATLEALAKGDAALVVVASDAASVTRDSRVARAIASGDAVAWKTKSELGALLGGEEIASCAVRHDGIASELKKMRAMAEAVGARSSKWWSLEAR
jgi:ribosomal protein L7Ae-like RNA K-turn-binding protein